MSCIEGEPFNFLTERDFANTNYDDIKQVFSIWICMDVDQNGMNYVHLTNDRLSGSYEWEGRLICRALS